jgi:hypothetical protein
MLPQGGYAMTMIYANWLKHKPELGKLLVVPNMVLGTSQGARAFPCRGTVGTVAMRTDVPDQLILKYIAFLTPPAFLHGSPASLDLHVY